MTHEYRHKTHRLLESGRTLAEDDFWGGEDACISLTEAFTFEALQGLASFSHAEVLFLFHQVPDSKILDAIDGTPVLDIKPVLAEFLPRQEIRQPGWSHELMRDYWNSKE
jgi:tRNA (Thr-GGU) A37 N-methylase